MRRISYDPKILKVIHDKLKKVARQKQLITYGELATLIGLDWYKNFRECLHILSILEDICEYEVKQGHPMLSAIVVRQDTRMPGPGFFIFARRLGRYKSGTKHSFWINERNAAWDLWSRDAKEVS